MQFNRSPFVDPGASHETLILLLDVFDKLTVGFDGAEQKEKMRYQESHLQYKKMDPKTPNSEDSFGQY